MIRNRQVWRGKILVKMFEPFKYDKWTLNDDDNDDDEYTFAYINYLLIFIINY